jgi:hypothetical protein
MIAIENDEAIDVWQRIQTEANRVAGATRRIPNDRLEALGGVQVTRKIAAFVADDDGDDFRASASAGAQDAVDHRNPGDGVQGFGNGGTHARPGARGEDKQAHSFVW